MKELDVTLTQDKERPWFFLVKFRYNQRLIEWIKQFPGRQWVKEEKGWLFPVELADDLKAYATSLRLRVG